MIFHALCRTIDILLILKASHELPLFVSGTLRPSSTVTVVREGRRSTTEHKEDHHAKLQQECQFLGELVGQTGRIGSYLLRSGNGKFVGVARNDSPGLFSEKGCPIFVSVPANEVPSVIYKTIPSRRRDLVLVTNGIPALMIQEYYKLRDSVDETKQQHDNECCDCDCTLQDGITTTVPHFGVLSKDADPISSPLSPPTIIQGRHHSSLVDILSSSQIKTEIVSTEKDINIFAVRKLLWVSIMWLLCHDHDCEEEPIDVSTVHRTKSPEVMALVKELTPAADSLLNTMIGFTTTDDASDDEAYTNTCSIGNTSELMKYMESYSMSMPKAIPNKFLAMNEITHRNGLLLSTSVPQELHKEYIKRVTGSTNKD